jgi:hypothetical protein
MWYFDFLTEKWSIAIIRLAMFTRTELSCCWRLFFDQISLFPLFFLFYFFYLRFFLNLFCRFLCFFLLLLLFFCYPSQFSLILPDSALDTELDSQKVYKACNYLGTLEANEAPTYVREDPGDVVFAKGGH